MTSQHPDTSTGQHRRRAAIAALTFMLALVAPLVILGTATGAEAASARNKVARIVEPTSVTVASTSCNPSTDGGWDATVTFKVTGGHYLNLGAPTEASQAINERDYDNVRGGGTRYVTATKHFYYHPGYTENGPVTVATSTFTYQHAIAPVTAGRAYVSNRSVRLLSRDIEASFTCA